jgi:2-hydroxy-3-keto-5-methylthiopentenyl-1-phosphate phosphatase
MIQRQKPYRGLVSSDWSECLSPNGPFDFIRFTYPELGDRLADIFRDYTGNQINLTEASAKVETLMPEPVSSGQMDAYLDEAFRTYPGVAELIEWCRSHDILFMINTTGMIGYFQRVFAKKLLPRVAVLSANPLIRYPEAATDPDHVIELFEIQDKGRNSAAVAKTMGIKGDKIIILGDSGGDGPHFEWGSQSGATLVGSMTKKSLHEYCRRRHIRIHHRLGTDFSKRPPTGGQNESVPDLMELCGILDRALQV